MKSVLGRLALALSTALTVACSGGDEFSSETTGAGGSGAGAGGGEAGGAGSGGASPGGTSGTGGAHAGQGGAHAGASGSTAQGGTAAGAGGHAGQTGGSGGQAGGQGGAPAGGAGGQGGSAAGGQAGAPGGSGGQGGTSAACATNQPPTASAGPDQSIAAGAGFTLDGSASSDPDGDTLSFAWTGPAGSPALLNATTAMASGLASSCGPFVYTLTVTDACGHIASSTMTLLVAANGQHVSSTTCDPAMECGTVKKPWCTVQGGVNGALVSPVKVASGTGPYTEDVVMKDGMDVQGGFEGTFLKPRVTDPITNGCQIAVAGADGVSWGPAVKATLDGFTIQYTDDATPPPIRAALSGDGTAKVDLRNIHTSASPLHNSTPVSLYGVWMKPGAGGSLSITGTSQLDALSASGTSAVVFLDTGFHGNTTIAGASLFAGSADQSHGILHQGTGGLGVTGGTIKGGNGATASTGVRATVSGGILGFQGSVISAGASPLAIGIDAQESAFLSVAQGTNVTGGGLANGTAIGVRADGVASLTIGAAQITGSTPLPSGNVTSGVGVQILTSGTAGVGTAVIDGATSISGGDGALSQIGIEDQGVPMKLSKSLVRGSTKGTPVSTVGVRVSGVFPPNSTSTISTSSVFGGPATSTSQSPYLAEGIEIGTVTPVTVDSNVVIRGCDPICAGPGLSSSLASVGAGVRVMSGASHVVSGNAEIRGGPHALGVTNSFIAHTGIGVVAGSVPSAPLGATISGNTLIVGHDDPAAAPEQSFGVIGVGAGAITMAITNNVRISGGAGVLSAQGIAITPSAVPNSSSVTIASSAIDGGTAAGTVGITITNVSKLSIRDNVVQACALPGIATGPAAGCLSAVQSDGLYAFDVPGARISNNYVFGGFGQTAIGCVLGNEGVVGQGESTLIDNLCFAQGRTPAGPMQTTAVGLRLLGSGNTSPIGLNVLDNILSSGVSAASRFATDETPVTVTNITYVNNDLLPADPMGTTILYRRGDGTPLTLSGINLQPGHGANVSADPGFLGATPFAPTAAGYHISGSSAIAHLGKSFPGLETLDYDNQPRGTGVTGSATAPAIGPDEP